MLFVPFNSISFILAGQPIEWDTQNNEVHRGYNEAAAPYSLTRSPLPIKIIVKCSKIPIEQFFSKVLDLWCHLFDDRGCWHIHCATQVFLSYDYWYLRGVKRFSSAQQFRFLRTGELVLPWLPWLLCFRLFLPFGHAHPFKELNPPFLAELANLTRLVGTLRRTS
jgi:hypothetical protein